MPGTVARGELRDHGPYWTGKDAGGAFVTTVPVAGRRRRCCARGAERFDIYCAACHDERGDGKGILFERGKVPTREPSYDKRIREMPDGQIFDTITNGKGLMPAYRYPIPVRDRWAIIAHVRELQTQRPSTAAPAAQVKPRRPRRHRRRRRSAPAVLSGDAAR